VTRPAWASLSTPALRHNLERVRHYAPRARVMAVVKADGYGHGLTWVANALEAADAFAVASVEEGAALRAAGVQRPICVLGGFYEEAELTELVRHRLEPVIHSPEQIETLERARGIEDLEIWLKLDSGMHRVGFAPEAAAPAAQRLRACGAVARLRWMSHLANADDPADGKTAEQIRLFRAQSESAGTERSLANSAGVVAWPDSHFEWVRPGIMLYGASPLLDRRAADLGLRPVMTLQSRIIAVHRRRRGEAIGYGGDYVCPEDMPVGVVAIGYGDGYPRHARPGTPLLVEGVRVPLIGRVSMDMVTVDLRPRPATRVGAAAVLWGEDLPVDEIARHAGTISYELLCGVSARVARVARD
jgi:alanine racemase